ncbi:50S ribosomal protein L14e [archaeon]|jgi:large subunit ribosomal protein L14e|nr:50S ribosomal protein L14e [archaeon]
MYEIGRLCVKIAGRDARLKCVIIDVIDDTFVMIDGQTRRRKCNKIHIEPLDKVLKLKKDASHSEVVSVLKKEGIEVVDTKPKKATVKPTRQLKKKETPVKETKKPKVKPVVKKEESKPVEKLDELVVEDKKTDKK